MRAARGWLLLATSLCAACAAAPPAAAPVAAPAGPVAAPIDGPVAGSAAAPVAESAKGWPAQVILVRHADKGTAPAGDVSLSEAGVARAAALAASLRDAGVTAILTTEYRRTRETAAPLALQRSIVAETVPPASGGTEAHIAAAVAALRAHSGEVVLVVGHGNTVPRILAALGGPQLPDFCDSSYSHLLVLTPGAAPKTVIGRYGAPDAPPAAGCF